jgi:predicted ATPase
MVGRQRERRRVIDAFHQAVADQSCQLFTVLGAAGVGKSRLVAEVTETVEDVATVAVGRCLPYGDGLTWWPLAEAIGQSGLLERAKADDARAATRAAELLAPGDQAVVPEEAFRAVRKVLETIARRRPLVLVIDDLQWAEPTFIDLLEHVGDYTRDAPLLLLIMARLELLDVRPGWGGGKLNATTLSLEPLPERDAADLLVGLTGPQRLSDTAAARILALAEGNPLFVEEVVAMLIDDGVLPPGTGTSEWPVVTDVAALAVPLTIHALLAARLDRLRPAERAVIEAASIEGKQFARDRLKALLVTSLATGIDGHLAALVRKDLIRPIDTNEDAFRFRHQLIRDAAYDAMPKDTRADLHERFADELQATSSTIPVAEELLGYHLERAVILRRELGAPQASLVGLAKRASASLRAAGRRAALRDDPASVRLLERALALAAPAERPAILAELAAALDDTGDLPRADEIAASAIKGAREAGDRQTVARAQLVALRVRSVRGLRASDLASFDSEGSAPPRRIRIAR